MRGCYQRNVKSQESNLSNRARIPIRKLTSNNRCLLKKGTKALLQIIYQTAFVPDRIKAMPNDPSEKSIQRMRVFVEKYCEKSGTTVSPVEGVTEQVILGLAQNIDEIGRPLCPCRFYPDKNEEVKHRTWICACDDMQIYKYCH